MEIIAHAYCHHHVRTTTRLQQQNTPNTARIVAMLAA